ncbi:MAG: hypothetical protein COA85_01300 [Robiginitomaculum sp.]|nr:MAG: hypothetical protein COA85_01300 [Robiginitomaculum sp.]
MQRVLNWLSLLTLIGAGIVLPEVVGAMQKGYSSSANYLSELGAYGAPHALLITYGSFLPIALAIVILVVSLFQKLSGFPKARLGALCLLGIAIGYLGAVLFRCDAGCPETGTGRQALHNLGGLIEYSGAIFGLSLIYFGTLRRVSRTFSTVTLLTVVMVILGFIMMLSPQMQEWKGGWQRLAEYSLVFWFVYASFWRPELVRAKPYSDDLI